MTTHPEAPLSDSPINQPTKEQTMSKLQPIGDRVLVRPDVAEETTASGIVLAQAAQEKPSRGTVLSVGEGRWDNGQHVPVCLSAGDSVLYSKYGSTEIKHEDEELLILRESDVLAVYR